MRISELETELQSYKNLPISGDNTELQELKQNLELSITEKQMLMAKNEQQLGEL